MSATTTMPPDVAAYLAAVHDALGDLPAAERDDLVAEVELSVLDAASEGGAIAARLGPPEEFAAELRAAAGLEATGPARGDDAAARAWRRAVEWWGGERAAALRRVAYELAPIWWVARGYVAVAAFGMLFDDGWSTDYPGVPRLGGGDNGLFAIALVSVLSVLLGMSTRRRPRALRLVAALNVVLAVAVLPVAVQFADGAPRTSIYVEPAPAAVATGLSLDGVPIDNVYPYSRDGILLQDVLLYDGAGRPLDVRPNAPDPDRRVLTTVGGVPLFNSFPVRYFDPGTTIVADPDAGPALDVPEVVTPPLDSGSTP